MSTSSPVPPLRRDRDMCPEITDAGLGDAQLRCSLLRGHDVGEEPTEHEAWALDDGVYTGAPQLLASWPAS